MKGSKNTRAIPNPKAFADAFASAVLAPSANRCDWVAKKGPESLFSVLERMMPQV